MGLATENRRPRAPSTDCCLGILEALSQHPEGLTLSDLHRLLDVSKNMVSVGEVMNVALVTIFAGGLWRRGGTGSTGGLF